MAQTSACTCQAHSRPHPCHNPWTRPKPQVQHRLPTATPKALSIPRALLPSNTIHRAPVAIVCQAEATSNDGLGPSAKTKRAPRRRKQSESAPSIVDPAPQLHTDMEQRALDIQEQETDVTIDEIMQLQYEVPTDEQLDQEAEEALQDELTQQQYTQSQGALKTSAPQGLGGKQEQGGDQAPPMLDRKAAILLELIAASKGSDLDNKIAQFVDDVDDELLGLLQTRIEAVKKVNPRAADQLRELHGILRVVQYRQDASPSTRLLDDLLDLLGEDMVDSQGYSGRRMEAMARMQEAFSGGTGRGLDIFAAAAALADAGPMAAAELASEAVDPVEFMTETTKTLQDAKESQTQLGEDIERAEKELRYIKKHQPELLQQPHAKQHLVQLHEAKRVHANRAVALSQLQDVLLMARQVTSDKDFLTDA